MRIPSPVIAYRPDIDGLRAFAVAAVVLFHVFPEVFPGGFIGVDVFFVISGYLISRIIMRDAEQGQFTLCHFYARRIRRIFPSLLTVLTIALVFGWFALLPEEYKALGKHVAGGAGFIDNFLLWFEAGYFDVESRAKPLLHLWSLGIEEQFYAVLPVGLWFCAKKRCGFSLPLAIVCLLSFTAALYLRGTNTTAAFYSPVSRFWELFAGCVLASLLRQPETLHVYQVLDQWLARLLHREQGGDGRSLSLCLALCGAGMLLCSLVTAKAGEAWPGWNTWLPVGGTVALIAAGPLNAISSYVLSNRLSVYMGKISFPIYLWHWPLIAFLFILQYPLPFSATVVKWCIIVVAIILASITYHTVEAALRFRIRHRLVPVFLCIAMGCICSTGFFIYRADGVLSRLYATEYIRESQRIDSIENTYTKNCLKIFPDWEQLSDINLCRLQGDLDTLDTVIIGDSHADHLFMGLAMAETAHKFGVFPASGAAPYLDVMSYTRQGDAFRKHGRQLINRAYNVAIAHDNIRNVVLSHRPYCSYVDIIDVQHPDDANRDRILERAMRRSFALLQAHHKHVVVILDTPASPIHPRNCVQRPYDLFTNYQMCRFSRRDTLDADAARNWYNGIVRRVAAEFEDISIVDLGNVFCDDSFCYLLQNNAIIYRDNDHLSRFGSRLVAPHILPHLQ